MTPNLSQKSKSELKKKEKSSSSVRANPKQFWTKKPLITPKLSENETRNKSRSALLVQPITVFEPHPTIKNCPFWSLKAKKSQNLLNIDVGIEGNIDKIYYAI